MKKMVSVPELANRDRYAVVLCGGSGTRLWPKSRAIMPKQLQALNGESSLLQQTISRILPILVPQNIWTVTGREYMHEVSEQLKTVHAQAIEHILSEPVGKNTLPAIAWATARIASQNPEAIIAVFPSDHAVENEENLLLAWLKAEEAAREGNIVLLGVQPTFPATGYGYAQLGNPRQGKYQSNTLPVFQVKQFVEKPDYALAQRFLNRGGYLWNSGIFVFQAKKFMQMLAAYQPQIYEAELLLADLEASAAPAEVYGQLPDISIDHGVLEKTDQIAVVAADLGWSDLGSWEAIYLQRVKDDRGNLIIGQVQELECHNNLLWSDHGLLAALGIEGLAVIQTPDATLICPRNRCQDVKSLVASLKLKHQHLLDTHVTVSRPWGSYSILDEGPFYKVKRILVKPGGKLSLQMHYHRSEHWIVIAGTAKVTNGNKELFLEEGQSVYIPQTERHRLENLGPLTLEIIEVQTGQYIAEDDIVRFDDIYGRIEKNA